MKHTSTPPQVNATSRSISRTLRKHRSVLGFTALVALACGATAGWLSEPSYEPAAAAEIPSGEVKGLVLLVSFSDQQISNDQARRIWRRINERGYPNGESGVTESGSVRDYFADMSTSTNSSDPLLELTSDVVHVRLPDSINEYDQNVADDFKVPTNIFNVKGALSNITAPGPATKLLQAATCRLTGCDGQPVEYDLVTGSSVTRQTTAYSFDDLTTRTFSYWPDAYLRENFGRSHLGRDFSIPRIETFAYLGLIYAGAPSHGGGRGLWPRSVATPGTRIAGSDSTTRAARFFITGTWNSASTPLGTLVHESAHTLFDFHDLYDGGEEVGLSTGATESFGIGAHGLMGHASVGSHLGTWERPQNLSAPMRDRLGWAHVIDLNDLPEGTTVELTANGVDVARYCRQNSPTNECFYIEARHRSSPRSAKCAAADCTLESAAEGLAIWHAENPKNAMDFVVNNHELTTANIHNQVVLVEATGTNELLQPRAGATVNYADHYFRSGHVDRFDSATPASSRWWDGTPSGLNIKNISNPGSTMTFELGPRPVSRIFTDTDERVQVQLDTAELPVGATTRLVTTAETSARYDVHIYERSGGPASETRSYAGLQGRQEFEIAGVEGDVHVEVVSYPSAANPAAVRARFHAFMAEGTEATTYAAEALEYSGLDRMVRRHHRFVTVLPGREVGWTPDREADVTIDVPEVGGRALWVAKARPGYMLRSIEAYRVGDSARQTVTTSGAGELSLSVDVSAAALGDQADYIVLVNAEPVPNLLCASDRVEPWRDDTILNDVGDLVRFGDTIYASNVPRNLIQRNLSNGAPVSPPVATPENSTSHWTPVALCGEYQATCSGLPQWELDGITLPEGFTGDVVFNGARYTLVGSQQNEVPGAFASRQIRRGVATFSEVDPTYPLESNRLFIYSNSASWRLQGHCSDTNVAGRASVITSGGIASVSSSLGTKTLRDNEPAVVHESTGSFTLQFSLRAGFELDSVLIDGIAQTVAANATSVAIPAASGNQPRVIELRTRPL